MRLSGRRPSTYSAKELGVEGLSGTIECFEANADLEQWEGNLRIKDTVVSCDIRNLLLRGCTLKNTSYVIGICCYVGNETKILKNMKKPERKISKIFKIMNRLLLSVFFIQIVIIIVLSALSVSWMNEKSATLKYLKLDRSSNPVARYILQFFTFWVAYSHMVPMSLYIVIELFKLFLSRKMVDQDVLMYYPEDGQYASCQNSDLIEELG